MLRVMKKQIRMGFGIPNCFFCFISKNEPKYTEIKKVIV